MVVAAALLRCARLQGAELPQSVGDSVARPGLTPVTTVTQRFAKGPSAEDLARQSPGFPGKAPSKVGPPPGAPPTPVLPPDAAPTLLGPFRLIPAGWTGETTSEVIPIPPSPPETDDRAQALASPLYREVPPQLLVAGLELVYAEGGARGVVLSFGAPGIDHLSLRVVRQLQTERPENRVVSGGARTFIVDWRYTMVNDMYPPG